jgi:ribonucleoside-diphosphate reductase beta chain
LQENPEVNTEDFRKEIYKICETIVTHEDAFIELVFGMGEIEGLTEADIKKYIRFIANRRLMQLSLQPMYQNIERNPLPWMDEIMNGVEHANFFENRVTEYTKAATTGSWDEAFA